MVRRKDPEAKRVAILDAAVAEMAARGYAGANTADIATAAGVGVGTVFRLFRTKQELANKVLQRALERYDSLMDLNFATVKSPRTQFALLFKMLVDFYHLFPNDFIFAELHFVGPFIDETSNARRQAFRARTDLWTKSMIDAGVLRVGPPEVMRAIVVGSFARLVRESRDTNTRMTNKAVAFIEQCTWEAMVHKKD